MAFQETLISSIYPIKFLLSVWDILPISKDEDKLGIELAWATEEPTWLPFWYIFNSVSSLTTAIWVKVFTDTVVPDI